MNHYPHHIGDFNNATRHLTRVERSLYRDLIDLYYDTELPLNGDFEKLARRIICDDNDKAALRDVLNEFFVLQDDGYHNDRCDKEIALYHGKIEQASRAGKASAAKRSNQQSTDVERALNGRTTNQNQNQNQNHKEANASVGNADLPPGFVDFWKTWPITDRKQAKGKCLEAWKKAHAGRDAAAILAHVEKLKSSDDWKRESGRFIPAPLVYLNGRRWEGAESVEDAQQESFV